MVALSGLVLIWNLVSPVVSVLALFIAGMVFTLSITVAHPFAHGPRFRARASIRATCCSWQAKRSRPWARKAWTANPPSASAACCCPQPRLSPSPSPTIDFILGYAGYEESHNLSGSIIRTHATYSTLSDGKTRVLFTPEEIGFPKGTHGINAAIIVPLTVGKRREGHAEVLLPSRATTSAKPRSPSPTGFGQLLSTQMAASALEEQTALATKHGAQNARKARSTRTSCSTPSTPSLRSSRTDPAQRPYAAARVRRSSTAARSRIPAT